MGSATAVKRDRKTKQQAVEAFGLKEMAADISRLADNQALLANANTALAAKLQVHENRLAGIDNGSGALTRELGKVAHDHARLVYAVNQHKDNLSDLNALRSRGFFGRVQWLLTGR